MTIKGSKVAANELFVSVTDQVFTVENKPENVNKSKFFKEILLVIFVAVFVSQLIPENPINPVTLIIGVAIYFSITYFALGQRKFLMEIKIDSSLRIYQNESVLWKVKTEDIKGFEIEKKKSFILSQLALIIYSKPHDSYYLPIDPIISKEEDVEKLKAFFDAHGIHEIQGANV